MNKWRRASSACFTLDDSLDRAAADDLEQIGRYLKDHQPALAQSTVHTLYDVLGRTAESARERATHVERRLEELHQRAEEGAPGR